jgi:predicted  nucleic acid-binding Zn-ribbon protein
MSNDPDDVDELRREIARLSDELTRERAYFAAELAEGAAELDRSDRRLAQQKAVARRATSQRDEAVAALERSTGSRIVRLAARASGALHQLRRSR